MIKPYVSGSRGAWEVLDAKGKPAATFKNINDACSYLHENWASLCKARTKRQIAG